MENSAKALQKEAQYRLRKGQGIRVHGYPEQLVEWFKSEKIDPETREGLLLHAGDLVPGFSAENGEIEIFIHSPFSYKLEEKEENRNDNSIVWHLTFFTGNEVRKVILGADATHQDWADIVKLTEISKNEDRLVYDLFRTSHHCSYLSLSEDKGKTITTPREEMVLLFDKGNSKYILISSSWQILNEESTQPPHFQAKAFYKKVVQEKGNSDNFCVTMELPDAEQPEPIFEPLGANIPAHRRAPAFPAVSLILEKRTTLEMDLSGTEEEIRARFDIPPEEGFDETMQDLHEL